ncbi:hypothetical protein FF100_05205 [Methylobacterium terricola]|uniref:Uncharacterized protein n=1 Tax=Methylobacterium terricola TaxID=2583531 RepID=A0A5C4LN09_9HYPH|nr:hypothetical protein [Methylobacterium terricola]TNC14970.1 hypothetical protein FF100_05205 [Methylobacterium terricola]
MYALGAGGWTGYEAGDPAPSRDPGTERTHHLDSEAVEALEAGLSGYDGALLVVRHDAAFLRALRIMRRVGLGDPAG